MAQVEELNEPKTCEEYVLLQLKECRRTLTTLSNQYYDLRKEYCDLVALVKEMVNDMTLTDAGENQALKKLIELYKGEVK